MEKKFYIYNINEVIAETQKYICFLLTELISYSLKKKITSQKTVRC